LKNQKNAKHIIIFALFVVVVCFIDIILEVSGEREDIKELVNLWFK